MKQSLKKFIQLIGLMPVTVRLYALFAQFAAYSKWRALSKQEQVYLELGSGAKKGANGWTTIDVSGADISHDLRFGIPLPNNSVDRIYTSHMFEHIPYKSLLVFIKECFRVLKPGGELSVCVPNAGYYIRAYINRERFQPVKKGYEPAIVDTGSYIDQVNYIAYMDELHKYMFDDENLINTLKHAPFKDVRLREFDDTLDLESRDFQSIYALAIK